MKPLSRLFAAAVLTVAALPALAQEWPTQALKIIVPYPPSGSSDIIARAIAQPLSKALKQTVVAQGGVNAETREERT